MAGLVDRYFVVPHTHWDREWYRPFEHFQLRLGSVVDEILDVLERDPEFGSFTLDGQAIVLEDYLAIRPANEGRLRALIAAGRIEIGPSYVLPDEFLVGGEPLVRNLLIGRAVCERFGGRPSPAGYLPDSFGHPLQLPQILAGFGLQSFLFSRGLGDEFDELGVAFRWAAPDGSAVLALQLLDHYGNFAHLNDADDAQARVETVLDRFGERLARAGIREVVLCNGTDHARVQPQLPSLCAELERRFPGASFTIARYGDYVSALAPGELPVWTGELLGSRLWNVLRGVNSARLYLKQANERAEQRLVSVETLAALCALQAGRSFPGEDFRFAWQELLKCHPHDSICGCSCDEVHRDMLVRYASLERTLGFLEEAAVTELGGAEEDGGADSDGRAEEADGERRTGLFNPLPFARTTLVRTAGSEPTLVELAGFEARTVALAPAEPTDPRPGQAIRSDRFSVEAGGDGALTIEDLDTGRRFERLHRLEDEADAGDLYNFCPVPGAPERRLELISTRILADGPTVWELELNYGGENLAVTTVVRLVRGADRVQFETAADNQAQDHRLRVVFGVGEANGPVRAEGQFAVVHRPLVPAPPRTEWCEPPDPTQHAIGVVALGPLALLTRGLPEYEARIGRVTARRNGPGPAAAGREAAGAELCLTLLRCVGVISRGSGEIPTRPLGAGPPVPTPEGQCLGRHVLHYALRFDADRLDEVGLLRASQDYRAPFLSLPAGVSFAPPLAVEGNVVFSCLKGAEDGGGLVLRVFNPEPHPATVRVRGPVRSERTRLDESPAPAGHPDEVGPYEIATFRLRPET